MNLKVLIANRGEIACRIIKTCRKMGLQTVAVYSEADAGAKHTQMADEAFEIGAPPVRDSYLNMTRILEVAMETGAEYVHPGYGLLSENPEFARRVEAAKLRWVGPTPDCMIAMADKERARTIAIEAGVPVLKGSDRIPPGSKDVDYDTLAAEIGLPALVKAVAGGGGIGMRICKKTKSIAKNVATVSELAERTFGDGTVIVERFIERARHVEIQVFGFGDGRVLSLFDRDCSTQRRFQKIIEEAPAPTLPDAVRAKMSDAACALASSQKYRGAGTVEFIVDAVTNEFFFLEMNTRLQVEHPVTEMITGLDIVEMQLRLAAGENVKDIVNADLRKTGHAIECRIYAEDPDKNFFPAPGMIAKLQFPKESSQVRVDIGVVEGATITPFYDPLIAKLICSGKDREDARRRLSECLAQTEIVGLTTNLSFLRDFAKSSFFETAELSTKVVDRYMTAREYRAGAT